MLKELTAHIDYGELLKASDRLNITPTAKEVINLILERERSNSRSSGEEKLCIVVEGGFMRGVVSGGALLALDLLGLNNVFDAAYGTSAGAINLSYFLSRQGTLGITIYYQDLPNRKFVNPLRFNKMVDIDYLIFNVMKYIKPLNVKAVLDSTTPLYIATTDFESAEEKIFSSKDARDPDEFLSFLRATASMPGFCGGPITIRGRKYVDGLITNPLPIKTAIDDGCTHILVLLSRRCGDKNKQLNLISKAWMRWLMRNYPQKLIDRYWERYSLYNEILDICQKDHYNDAKICTICVPEGSYAIKYNELNPQRLKKAAVLSALRTLRLFGIKNGQLVETLKLI